MWAIWPLVACSAANQLFRLSPVCILLTVRSQQLEKKLDTDFQREKWLMSYSILMDNGTVLNS